MFSVPGSAEKHEIVNNEHSHIHWNWKTHY